MAGLDPLQLILVGTVLELAVFLAEVPTGVIADVYSRRPSIILGVALATVYVGLSLIVGGGVFILLALFLSVTMTERGFTRTPVSERGGIQSMAQVFRTGLRAVSLNRLLMALVAIELFFGLSSEPFDRLWAQHALDTLEFPSIAGLDPIVWFGVVQPAASLGGLVAMTVIEKFLPVERPWGPRLILSAANAVMIAVTAAFAFTGSFGIAFGMVIIVYILHRIAEPYTAVWINRNCESEYRATVFSLHEQANSFGQVIFGPGWGLLATVRGLRTALIGVSILLAPPQLLYLVRERGPNTVQEGWK